MAFRQGFQARNSQPQEIAGLDWNHPLAPDVQSIWTPSGVILRDGAFVSQSPGAPVAGLFGLGHAFNGTNQQIPMPSGSLVHTDGARVAVVRIGSASGIRHFSAGGGSSIGFRTNGTTLEMTRAFVTTVASSPAAVVAGETAVLGCTFTVSGVPGGIGRGLFKNGVALVASTQGVSSPGSNFADALMASGSSTQYGDHTLFAHFSFSRPLNEAEHADIAANPWALFEPQRIWVPVAAVAQGVTLAPPRLSNSQAFPAPAVAPAPVSLSATLIANAQAFHAPGVSRGAIGVAPALLTNAQAFYSPSVASGQAAIQVPLLVNVGAFHTPAVVPGAAQVSAQLLVNASSFHAPAVSTGGAALQPPLVESTNEIRVPAVVPGAVQAAPPLLANASTVHAPTVSKGEALLQPPLLASTEQFFAPAVAAGAVEALPPLLASTQIFYSPSVSDGPIVEPARSVSRTRFVLQDPLARTVRADAPTRRVLA